jgi:hypothetical protein
MQYHVSGSTELRSSSVTDRSAADQFTQSQPIDLESEGSSDASRCMRIARQYATALKLAKM